MALSKTLCPCCSNLDYSECCQPLHQGQAVTSAEALMRSRFSAFALGNSEYLLNSWHPSTRPASLELDKNEQWLMLNILATGTDWVHFTATFREQAASKEFLVLEEKSQFVQENGHWLYVDGEHQVSTLKVGRNDDCPCASGKKFKKCCG